MRATAESRHPMPVGTTSLRRKTLRGVAEKSALTVEAGSCVDMVGDWGGGTGEEPSISKLRFGDMRGADQRDSPCCTSSTPRPSRSGEGVGGDARW
jgi:hypothetical protein